IRIVPGRLEDVLDGQPEIGVAVVRLAERRPRHAGEVGHGDRDRCPAQPGGALIGLGEGPAGQEHDRDRKLLGGQAGEVLGEKRRLLGGPGRGGDALGDLAPATHAGYGIPSLPMGPRRWFPDALAGERVVLRRHAPENLEAFQRWYSDPEVVRLTRYQDGPMRHDEIERFFAARALGADSLSMAIHVGPGARLIGTCPLSQLDADTGWALFHITIGEKDAWGRGYGTDATRLMVDHAFTGLGLHRIALTVFAFNDR